MDRIEQRIVELIDRRRGDIVSFARDVFDHAELGYKEFRTAERFARALREQGIETHEGLALTGVKGYLRQTGAAAAGPTIALIGELDALRIPEHPHANPQTQAAHSCGHHAQLAGVVGAALSLADPEVAAALDGSVVFFGVPSEEYGEVEFKRGLVSEGKIECLGGKAELIRIGAFEDVDLAVVHHSDAGGISVGTRSCNGFVAKVIRILGREAHAAGAPERGVNALNAASLGLAALAYQRETFRDEDMVRVHPIMTRGGNLVNVVPAEAVVETLVRARTLEAIEDADLKTDRSFKAGADALGAGYDIETMAGYLPGIYQPANPLLLEAAREAAAGRPVSCIEPGDHEAASTDVGDLQHVKPVLTFRTGGVAGAFHAKDFAVVDEEEAYIVTAKIFALGAYKLLKDGACGAREVVDTYRPVFTKQGYLDYLAGFGRRETKEVRA